MQSRHALGVSHEIGTVQQYMARTVRYASKKQSEHECPRPCAHFIRGELPLREDPLQ
jgi:hypothetical protein